MTASARFPPEELFRKFLKHSQENTLEEVLNDGDSRPETLLKPNVTALKQVTYIEYTLKTISLIGFPYCHKF